MRVPHREEEAPHYKHNKERSPSDDNNDDDDEREAVSKKPASQEKSYLDHDTGTPDLEELTAIYPKSGRDLHLDDTYGDWAVINIPRPASWLPNAYSIKNLATNKRPASWLTNTHSIWTLTADQRYIAGAARAPSPHDRSRVKQRPVHIITSSSIKSGILLPGIANIDGLNEKYYCNVLIVSMDAPDSKRFVCFFYFYFFFVLSHLADAASLNSHRKRRLWISRRRRNHISSIWPRRSHRPPGRRLRRAAVRHATPGETLLRYRRRTAG